MTNNTNSNPELFDNMNKSNTSEIKVIGVGGGGGNAVGHMYQEGIIGVDFAICNTDAQALEASPVPTKIQLGPELTEGRGAGSKPEIGKESCIESIDAVREFLANNTKMLFITAGMGGGTGTGAAPIIAKAAKEMGILTVGIVTKPFTFEGNKRTKYALEGIEKMRQNVDSLLVISNDKVREIFGDLSMTEAFGKADDILTTGARGIAEIITVPGYVNVDFEDVNTVMKGSGVAMMGTGEAEGEDRAKRAVEMALNSPLLQDREIRGANYILFNITSGLKEVTMDEISMISNYIQDEAGYGTDMIWGNCKNDDLGEKVSITIIATGFQENAVNTAAIKPTEIKVGLDDDEYKLGLNAITTPDEGSATITLDLEVDDVRSTIEEHTSRNTLVENSDPWVNISKTSNEERTSINELEKAKKEYLRKTKTIPLDNAGVVNQMESVPAYQRREVKLEDIEVANGDSDVTGTRVNVDDSGEFFNSKNSFLHDNVD